MPPVFFTSENPKVSVKRQPKPWSIQPFWFCVSVSKCMRSHLETCCWAETNRNARASVMTAKFALKSLYTQVCLLALTSKACQRKLPVMKRVHRHAVP